MILIPERELVVILVPRTGTRSLRLAVAKRYPKSILLYRHMEADGVPQGYDRWPKIGVVRHPVHRLWSLYKFLQTIDGPYPPSYIERMRASVQLPFNDWLVTNEIVFTQPHDWAGGRVFYPNYTVRHPMPETKKSQFHYLRPDLGTALFSFGKLNELERFLDVALESHHSTGADAVPDLTAASRAHIERWHGWDLEASGALSASAPAATQEQVLDAALYDLVPPPSSELQGTATPPPTDWCAGWEACRNHIRAAIDAARAAQGKQ